jgi:hypothetical protein
MKNILCTRIQSYSPHSIYIDIYIFRVCLRFPAVLPAEPQVVSAAGGARARVLRVRGRGGPGLRRQVGSAEILVGGGRGRRRSLTALRQCQPVVITSSIAAFCSFLPSFFPSWLLMLIYSFLAPCFAELNFFYSVFEDGVLVDEVEDISSLWRFDLVSGEWDRKVCERE